MSQIKFHVNPQGRVLECSAKVKCNFANSPHFDNEKEAYDYAESQAKQEHVTQDPALPNYVPKSSFSSPQDQSFEQQSKEELSRELSAFGYEYYETPVGQELIVDTKRKNPTVDIEIFQTTDENGRPYGKYYTSLTPRNGDNLPINKNGDFTEEVKNAAEADKVVNAYVKKKNNLVLVGHIRTVRAQLEKDINSGKGFNQDEGDLDYAKWQLEGYDKALREVEKTHTYDLQPVLEKLRADAETKMEQAQQAQEKDNNQQVRNDIGRYSGQIEAFSKMNELCERSRCGDPLDTRFESYDEKAKFERDILDRRLNRATFEADVASHPTGERHKHLLDNAVKSVVEFQESYRPDMNVSESLDRRINKFDKLVEDAINNGEKEKVSAYQGRRRGYQDIKDHFDQTKYKDWKQLNSFTSFSNWFRS